MKKNTEQLVRVILKKYETDSGCYNRTRYKYPWKEVEEDEDEVSIEDEVEEVFQRQKFLYDNFDVELVEIFENSSVTLWCLCIAWIEDSDKKLHSINVKVRWD